MEVERSFEYERARRHVIDQGLPWRKGARTNLSSKMIKADTGEVEGAGGFLHRGLPVQVLYFNTHKVKSKSLDGAPDLPALF